jgi:hypothetical protein
MIEETTNIVAETINNNAEETMTQVESYTQLINTYGASAVIVAVFIVVLIAMLFYILKANNVTHKQMIAQQQELVNMMMEMVKRGENIEKESKKPTIIKEPNLVELFLNINGTIKDTLKDISEDLETDRTSVYVFHNGIFSSHGLPFFKISCACEVVKKGSGVIKHLKDHSGMPLQLFDNTVSNIYKNGRMTVYDADDEEDEIVQTSPVLCGMLKNNSVKSATGIAIYDHDNNIMGILMVEYSDKKDPILLDEATNTLVTKAPLLSPVLEYSGIYDATNK